MNTIDFPSNPSGYTLTPWVDQNAKSWIWSTNGYWEAADAHDSLDLIVPWTRNPNWIAMPDIASGEQKMYGIWAVRENPDNRPLVNLASLVFYTSAGSGIVDWGDGTVVQSGHNTLVQHQFQFTGLSADTEFTTPDGVKFRQALVTLVPTGGNITALYLQQGKPAGHWGYWSNYWLDLNINLTEATAIYVGDQNGGYALPYLETARVYAPKDTYMAYLFANCSALKNATFVNTTGVTSFRGTFQGCQTLVVAPWIDMTSCTELFSMFNGCRLLRYVPDYDTSKVSLFTYVFSNCHNLAQAPNWDTRSATSFGAMFSACSLLEKLPIYNTTGVTSFSQCFYGCTALKQGPNWDTSNATDLSEMFRACSALTGVPLYNTSKNTSLSITFGACYALQSPPLWDTSKVTNFNSTFAYSSLGGVRDLPAWDFSSATTTQNMFDSVGGFLSIPPMNLTGVTNATSMFSACVDLRDVSNLSGISGNIGFWRCALDSGALVTLFNNLPYVTGSKTVTITACIGASSLTAADIAIATGKGWTVAN